MSKPMGGTELMAARVNTLPPDLLDKCQIIHTKIREELDPNKIKLYVIHDMPDDDEVQHLKNGGWKKFDKLVFVSHWQQEKFNLLLGIPYDAGVVIRNGIEPIDAGKVILPRSNKVRLIYTSTPHRGLNILSHVFKKIREDFGDGVELSVFSSFKIYGDGWEAADEGFEELYRQLKNMDGVDYRGTVDNETIRRELLSHDIFVLPSIWPETSCLSLIEAMVAGLICVHSSFGALPETGLGITQMYGYTEDINKHAAILYNNLYAMINLLQNETIEGNMNVWAKQYYDWNLIKRDWISLITNLTS